MDVDKIRQWLQFAQQIQGSGDFWNSIFDKDFVNSNGQQQQQQQHYQMNNQTPHPFTMEQPTAPKDPFPLVDILADEQFLYIIAALPGVAKEDLNLAVTNDTVILKGIIKPLIPNTHTITAERKYGPFERAIKLTESIDASKIKAKYMNGLLIVSFERIIRNAEPIDIE
ncbi:Hsp20/alpha crystallin family protein [Heyndrickxia camelliae]|uniref:Hsp20/alpha crystallin family protein n=1 Tax=Heyndrickxia camelliae TaxID=1707093 RepID=UPI001303348E|nr:Hsp20/alpha crystallin family protein [Heyndrickxia camelliae]